MQSRPEETDGPWDPATHRSEDQLVLAESVHRTANEISAAIAALRLVQAARGPVGRAALVDQALRRLEGFASTHRLLAHRPATSTNLGVELDALCQALADGGRIGDDQSMSLRLPDLWIDGATGRRLLLIAAEVVSNAVRHGLGGGGNRLVVSLGLAGTDVELKVVDDGPGARSNARTRGSGLGTGIVDDLVRLGEGTIERRSGSDGTSVRVTLPLDTSALARIRGRG